MCFLRVCLQVWNLSNMLPIIALQRHEKSVQAMAVWQDSVFTGSEDMEIKVGVARIYNVQIKMYTIIREVLLFSLSLHPTNPIGISSFQTLISNR